MILNKFSIYSRYIMILTVLCSATITACDPDWAKNLEFGRKIPDARLAVVLNEPLSNYELFLKFREAASLAGYDQSKSRELNLENSETDGAPSTFSWNTQPDAKHYPNRISFMFSHKDRNPSEFEFIFRVSLLEGFSAKEWQYFYEWKDVFMPTIFPDSQIIIKSHPANDTDFNDLIDISEETGIPIPEKNMKRYKEWLDASR